MLIHVGEVSGDVSSYKLECKEVWRVNEDGEIRDTFGKLSSVFEMPEECFFSYYSKTGEHRHSYHDDCMALYNKMLSRMPELPLSTIWVAQNLASDLPEPCNYHLGIWSSLRSFNYFESPHGTNGNCNVGGFGIDGNVSSLIGASLCNPEKLYIGIIGDLSFFYDMNVLGNRHVGDNVRLVVINNGQGNEMRYSFSPASVLKEDGKTFLAAAGHYGNQSKGLIKDYVENLGYEYLSASTKDEFMKHKKHFLSGRKQTKPIVFEVFIADEKDEELAYQLITTIEKDLSATFKQHVKSTVKGLVGEKGMNTIKSILKK